MYLFFTTNKTKRWRKENGITYLLRVADLRDLNNRALLIKKVPRNNLLLTSRWNTETVSIPEKDDSLCLTLSTLARLNKLAPTGGSPESTEEASWATFGVRSVVLAHNFLDSLSSLVGVVEGNAGNEVVGNVGLDDAVEEMTTDEAKFAINSCGGSTGVGPSLRMVVRKRRVGVLEECDSH